MLGLAFLICLGPTTIDGDPVKCAWTRELVRIFGVNSPEVGQPGAAEATAAMAELIKGGLYCEIRGASYNRLVGQCWNLDHVDVGLSQLANGHAVEWCSYSKNAYGTCPK